MSAISWTDIQQALVDWVKDSMTLDDLHVLWSGQGSAADRPEGTYVSLRMTSLASQGQASVKVIDNPSPSPGQEVLFKSRNQYRVGVTVTVYAPSQGDLSGHSLLIDMQEKSALPTRADALSTAGVGLADFSPILPIDGLTNSDEFDPRASMIVFFFVASEVIEATRFIEFVEIENLITGQSTYVPS